jgi:hypothetical protein
MEEAMKAKLAVALSLTAICLLLVTAGAGRAQPPALNYTVYLPVVSKPCPLFGSVPAYMTSDRPIVRVGDTVTVTGAMLNECGLVLAPGFTVRPYPTNVLTPSVVSVGSGSYADAIGVGSYRTFTMTFQATMPGTVTLSGYATYATIIHPPMEVWAAYRAADLPIRVVPN